MAFGSTYGGMGTVTFSSLSNQNEPMGRFNNIPVYVDRDYKTMVLINETYECQLSKSNSSNCYFAIPVKKIETPVEKNDLISPESIDIQDTNDQGIFDIIMFNELSKKNNPMGRYHNLSVFPDDAYRKDVAFGETYYCRLVKSSELMLFKATPLKKITLEDILESDPNYLDRLVSMVYSQDPTRFDQLITAQQLRENEEKVAEQYKKKITALEKENEHLLKQLDDGQRSSVPAIQNKVPVTITEGIRDGIFYSDKLNDCYYSARINRKGDVVLLVKDENGEYGGFERSIDIAPFKKLLEAENIKGMYCEKYSGVIFIKGE